MNEFKQKINSQHLDIRENDLNSALTFFDEALLEHQLESELQLFGRPGYQTYVCYLEKDGQLFEGMGKGGTLLANKVGACYEAMEKYLCYRFSVDEYASYKDIQTKATPLDHRWNASIVASSPTLSTVKLPWLRFQHVNDKNNTTYLPSGAFALRHSAQRDVSIENIYYAFLS